MIKVVHTSDLHLDGTFFKEDPKLNDRRRKERRALFVNIMMYVRDRSVDVLLISGDFFDGLWPERETAELILREFENTPGTEIFISPGRYDPYRPGCFYAERRFPSNVHIFQRDHVEATSVDRLNLTVYGYAFTGFNMEKNPIAVMPVVDQSRINLLCGYGTSAETAGMFRITPEQIGNTAVDYIALGGDHPASELKKEKETFYAYSGAPEGNDFGENGHKGVRLVAIEKQEGGCALNSKSMRFSRRHYEKMTVDVSAFSSVNDLISDLSDTFRSSEYDPDTILELEFVGRVPLHFGVISRDLFERIGAKLYYLKINDRTVIDFEQKDDTNDIREGFAMALDKLSNGDKALMEKAMRAGLAALEGKPF